MQIAITRATTKFDWNRVKLSGGIKWNAMTCSFGLKHGTKDANQTEKKVMAKAKNQTGKDEATLYSPSGVFLAISQASLTMASRRCTSLIGCANPVMVGLE